MRAAPLAAALPLALAAGCGPGAPAARDVGPYAIVWSTYLGGSALEEIREPRVRPDGALLVGARTLSRDMPVTAGALQPRYGGGQGDTWLGVLAPDGRLLAATYFGGSGMERPAYGLALHPSGDVVFASGTSSPDLPTSELSFRPRPEPSTPEPGGGYVARISGDLATLRWCTYTAGLWPRGGLALAADGAPIVAGTVGDPGFPATLDALQSEARGRDDAAILRLAADGSRALYATRLGGSGSAGGEVALSIAVAPDGDWRIAGITTSADFPTRPGAAQPGPGRPLDAFVARIGAGGSRLIASTLFGGSGDDGAEHPHALLPDGSVLIAGTTSSPDFPTTEGAPQREARGSEDGFLAKLDPDGARVAFATRLGGSGEEHLLGPVPAPDGSIWIGGATSSRDFPTTPDAIQTEFAGGPRDAVLVRMSGDGSRILYATYLGGSDDELVRGIALGAAGEIYAVGKTLSDDFPTTPGALQRRRAGAEDGFVVKLAPRSPGP